MGRWGRWGSSLVEELLIALAEAAAVVCPGGAGDRGAAEAGVVGEVGWAAFGYVTTGGFKAVVDALVMDLDGGRRWTVDGLGMGTAGQECGG